MTSRAPVDDLRALPPSIAVAVLARLDAEEVAALDHAHEFWARPEQRLPAPDDLRSIEVFVGERGTGKSWVARALFARELSRARFPRIVAATDAALLATVINGPSGLRRWTPPHVPIEFKASKGYAGDLLIDGRRVICCSAAAPGQGIGIGCDITWADDPAAWVESCGVATATRTWTEILKSNREGNALGISCVIVATTPAGAEFLWRLLTPGEQKGARIHDLGLVEANAGNLTAAYLRDTVPALRASGEWDEGSKLGAFAEIRWADLRVDHVPKLARIIVFVDPAKSSRHGSSCEVGIVAAGIDVRGTVYGLADRSGVMSASEWPGVALDLLDELRHAHDLRGAVGVEVNAGGRELLETAIRNEERLRRGARGEPMVATVEIRPVTSRPNDSKVARARDVVAMAKGRQVRMVHGLGVLEGQLSALSDSAPGNDRADAFVHAARDLAGISDGKAAKLESEREQAGTFGRAALKSLVAMQRDAAPGDWDMERA